MAGKPNSEARTRDVPSPDPREARTQKNRANFVILYILRGQSGILPMETCAILTTMGGATSHLAMHARTHRQTTCLSSGGDSVLWRRWSYCSVLQRSSWYRGAEEAVRD